MADLRWRPLILFTILLSVSFYPSNCETQSSLPLIRLPEADSGDGSSVPVERVLPLPLSCPVTCFTADPVCGVDGVTYWCGPADALCSGTQVANFGFCEIGNGGNGAFPGQAFLLIHIVWLVVLGFHFLLGFF